MKFDKLPGVMSLKRTVVITDGVMSSVLKDGSTRLVDVTRHGIRGTQNIVNDASGKDTSGKKDREVSNIQETDTAKLDADAVEMRVEFEMRFLPISSAIDACSDKDPKIVESFKKSIEGFATRSANSNGLKEVAARYARNIANGRWLWRNRTAAESIKVSVEIGGEKIEFDALSIPLNDFSDCSEDEKKLAAHIARGMSGQQATVVKVTADVDFGVKGAVEVFPSQNYIDGKPKGFARSLYKYGVPNKISKTDNNRVGYAAIRDQKIGNAIRTIDTWYAEFKETGVPIAIEPNGANLDTQRFFRKNSSSAFMLFLQLNEIDPDTEQGMFCIASLVRGGVYSGGKDGKGEE